MPDAVDCVREWDITHPMTPLGIELHFLSSNANLSNEGQEVSTTHMHAVKHTDLYDARRLNENLKVSQCIMLGTLPHAHSLKPPHVIANLCGVPKQARVRSDESGARAKR
jgi:hypothetical protein